MSIPTAPADAWVRAEVLPDGYVALTGLHERYVALLEKRWHDRVGS